jgi:hypothetical protein
MSHTGSLRFGMEKQLIPVKSHLLPASKNPVRNLGHCQIVGACLSLKRGQRCSLLGRGSSGCSRLAGGRRGPPPRLARVRIIRRRTPGAFPTIPNDRVSRCWCVFGCAGAPDGLLGQRATLTRPSYVATRVVCRRSMGLPYMSFLGSVLRAFWLALGPASAGGRTGAYPHCQIDHWPVARKNRPGQAETLSADRHCQPGDHETPAPFLHAVAFWPRRKNRDKIPCPGQAKDAGSFSSKSCQLDELATGILLAVPLGTTSA